MSALTLLPALRYWRPQVAPITCAAPTQVTDPSQAGVPMVTLVANPNSYVVVNPPLSQTGDNNIAGASYSGFAVAAGNADGVVVDYTWNVDQDYVKSVVLWNNGGTDLNDTDGIGTATVTLYDFNSEVLFTGPLTAGNGAAPFVTDLPEELNGVRRLRLSDITNLAPPAAPNVLWRNISLALAYHSEVEWECGDYTIMAEAKGDMAGLVFGAGSLVQTNGPHTLRFSSDRVFDATIVTNNPGNFSTLQISDGVEVVVSGDVTSQFSLSIAPYVEKRAAFGYVCCDEGSGATVTWIDAKSGERVDPELLVCY